MPNFFKKLTGALKMPEEDELFQDQNDEASPQEGSGGISEETQDSPLEVEEEIGQEESDNGQEEDIGDEDEIERYEEEEEEEDAEEETPQEDEEEKIVVEEQPQESMGEEEKPFTIAQLAKANTEKKTESKRFGAIRVQEEDEDGAALGGPEGQLAIDVYETATEIVLKSTIAGVKPEDLDIGIEDSTVNIRGSRHREDKVKGDNYFYQECYWGTFSRSVILPVEVDSEKVNASLKDGILTIRLPKIVRAKEKKIKVLAD